MSSLDKLAIRGIRSFDHNDLAVMQFYTPLTVIVGHNGSGKTTIIECLKYATTGDLPPNTKGGAFVHDPTIAGTSEVKAQVKLRFFNANKEQMLVERRLQVTKKKTGGGLTMKTLEGVISYVDKEKSKSKRASLSTKCAALDEEVPKQLGVSKAILENVIFCHQEESNWPLSEPAALKKKFDDIFEATKYTKALDQIKHLRKEQTVEIKVDKEKLAALKTDRDRAIRLRSTIEKLDSAIQGKQADHDDLETEIKKLADENRKFYSQATKHAEIINEAATLQTQRDLIETNLNQLRAVVKELSESDYELQKKIENHETDLAASYAEREGLSQRLGDERDAQEKLEKRRSQAQTSHGSLLASKTRYEENLQTRQNLIQETATRHAISGYDHDLTDDEVLAFRDRLEDAIMAQQKKIEDIKTEGRKLADEKQGAIQNLRVTRAADERAKSNSEEQLRSIKSRINEINRKLDSTTTSEADISYHESALVEEKKRRSELEEQIKTAKYSDSLRAKAAEARALEEQRDALHVELTSLNLQADVRAKLQLKRTENKRKDEAIQSLIDAHAGTYRKLIKGEPQRGTMEGEVAGVARVLEQDLKAADKSLIDARRELNNVETSVNISKSKVKELNAALTVAKKKIHDALKASDTPMETIATAIAEAQEEIKILHDNINTESTSVTAWKKLLQIAAKEKKCHSCDRGLSKAELTVFEKRVNKEMSESPDKLRGFKDDLEGWESQLAALKPLVPTEVSYEKLMNEDIPAAEEAVRTQSARLPLATDRADTATKEKSKLEGQIQEVQLLKKTAQDVLRMHRECEDITRDIAKLESELSASGSTATSDEIQAKLSEIGTQLRAASAAMDKLRTDSQKQNSTLQALVNSIHSAELELNKKRQDLRDKEALEKRKEDTKTEGSALEVKLTELEKKIRETDAPLRKLEDEASEARRQSAMNESVASRELQAYNKSSETLDTNSREIKQYETRGVANELAKVERDITTQERQISEAKARVQGTQNEISKMDKSLADSKSVVRNLNDNVTLRKQKKEIVSIEAKIDALDVESAKKAHRTYELEFNTMRKRQSDKSAQQSKLGGEISTMKSDLDDKRGELKSEYDQIDAKYKTELIKVKTAEVANDDLEKYGKALDTAIMSFHGVKMKEINDTIADLWTKTYQGTDIDKIMIKSEGEGKGARSYNYRVVMQKDNTEMDMRGRCSAGQKVLASIIIRLALAESFGVNCGILALDEPTTNLDHANIQALASALADLIRERQSQSNFQLLIITHDEQFLETLGGNGVIDKYWRVSRGDGGQVSTIERQRLT